MNTHITKVSGFILILSLVATLILACQPIHSEKIGFQVANPSEESSFIAPISLEKAYQNENFWSGFAFYTEDAGPHRSNVPINVYKKMFQDAYETYFTAYDLKRDFQSSDTYTFSETVSDQLQKTPGSLKTLNYTLPNSRWTIPMLDTGWHDRNRRSTTKEFATLNQQKCVDQYIHSFQIRVKTHSDAGSGTDSIVFMDLFRSGTPIDLFDLELGTTHHLDKGRTDVYTRRFTRLIPQVIGDIAVDCGYGVPSTGLELPFGLRYNIMFRIRIFGNDTWKKEEIVMRFKYWRPKHVPGTIDAVRWVVDQEWSEPYIFDKDVILGSTDESNKTYWLTFNN